MPWNGKIGIVSEGFWGKLRHLDVEFRGTFHDGLLERMFCGEDPSGENPFDSKTDEEGANVEDDPTRPEGDCRVELAVTSGFGIDPMSGDVPEDGREDEPEDAVPKCEYGVEWNEWKLIKCQLHHYERQIDNLRAPKLCRN